jgi:putative effector of murein hydrolase LrgA (UPF0299 family)
MVVAVLYGALYLFLIPAIYGLSIAAGRLGLFRLLVFSTCFVALAAGWSYIALAGYDFYQQGVRVLVVKSRITSAGWHDLALIAVEDLVIAVITGAVLFWHSKRQTNASDLV